MEPTAVPSLTRPEHEAEEAGDGGDRRDTRAGGHLEATAPGDVGLQGRWRQAATVVVVVVLLAGLLLRFWTRSAMWLDEALTVDIARLPLHDLPSYLKRDGAPPLYYALLHFWMEAFGTSDLGVRSLSGVISVATLPLAWLAARRFAGRTVAWVVLVLRASAPFAVYYGTEARMYSLVMLLTACGLLALGRVLEQPRPGNLLALAVVSCALLYSQYWALYLLGALGLRLLWLVWRRPGDERRRALAALGAVLVGFVGFVPWAPIFIFQARHTGTPWAAPPNFSAVINAVTGFTDNQASLSTVGSNQGRLLALGYFVLAGLGLFGVARDRRHIELDIRTRPKARGLTFVVVATLVAAVGGGIVSGSAFSPRYAAVVFVPLLIVIAFGSLTLADPRVRAVVVLVLAVSGLVGAGQNVVTERTEAPRIASVLAARAHPGDIVALCPDQLGPAVYRLTASKGFDEITYPRGTSPAYVDWVDYKQTAEASNPAAFARMLERRAGSAHDVWLVSAPGYQGFGEKCQQLAGDLLSAPGWGGHQWVNTNPAEYYEPMGLTQFAPPPPRAPATSAISSITAPAPRSAP